MLQKTSDLCDACEGVQACFTQLQNYGLRRAFGGRIRTVRCECAIELIRNTVNEPGDQCVLVIDGGGRLSSALFGEVMASIAVRNEWAGVVVYGAIRDVREIDSMDIGVKALGTVSRRGKKSGAGDVDIPVNFGGTTFYPGRYLVADEDGVVTLPEGLTNDDIAIENALDSTTSYANRR